MRSTWLFIIILTVESDQNTVRLWSVPLLGHMTLDNQENFPLTWTLSPGETLCFFLLHQALTSNNLTVPRDTSVEHCTVSKQK